ncbi:tetratricopeptide repeat protein, partial [Gammaproteobacteria bacterium]|nr:tetratricopeptide repeat protein [Gammaproteobacteria bacterium]
MKIMYYFLIFILSLIINIAYSSEGGFNYYATNVSTDNTFEDIFSDLKYDEANFELAYKAFVFNGSVSKAYFLARTAVKQNPSSILWRERLLQSSLWTNHVDDAMDQLNDLIIQKKQIKYLPQAIKQATQYYKYESLLKFLKYAHQLKPNNSDIILKLATTYDNLAMTYEAIELLKSSNEKKPSKKFLEKIVYIYNETGDLFKQKVFLKKIIKNYGNNEKVSLELAEVDYMSKNPKNALEQLNTVKNVPIESYNFYNTKAKLAWIVGDDDISRASYLKLYQTKQIDAEGVVHLIDLQGDKYNRETLNLSLFAWNKFHLPYAFLKIASLAPELQKWDILRNLYNQKLTENTLDVVSQQSEYYVSKAYLYQYAFGPQVARWNLLKWTLEHPKNIDLKVSYLNFLELQLRVYLNPQNPKYMYKAANLWKYKATSTFDWAKVYSTMFVMIHKIPQALQVYQDFQGNKNIEIDDVYWNATYIDILGKLNYLKSSY